MALVEYSIEALVNKENKSKKTCILQNHNTWNKGLLMDWVAVEFELMFGPMYLL